MSAFPVLEDPINANCPSLTKAVEVTEEELIKLENLTEICKQGGGQKAQQSYIRKKLLPRDRLVGLWDDPQEEMLEIAGLAGLGMPYGDVPGGGIVAGIGRVHGRWCLACANDGTLKGGTYFPVSVRKQLHASMLADKCGLPLIILVDSGGGFLPLQSELFPDKLDGGRMFYLEAVSGAHGVPSVAVVCGSCTAGGAYGPSMCEEAAILDGVGTLFLGGPPLVKAALGEDVLPEELGGAALHTGVSGVMDYFVGTEEESFAVVRDSISITNILPAPPPALELEEPLYSATTLDALGGRGGLDRDGMLAVIARLLDGSRYREFKARYGHHLTVGYGRIAGQLVGVVANCGPLSYQDGLKGAHFLQLCQHRDLPVIFLQNSGGPEQRQQSLEAPPEDAAAAVRGRTAMAGSVACLTTPKVAVNVAGLAHDDNFTMCGAGFEPTFTLSWPSGFVQYSHNSFQDISDSSSDVSKPAPHVPKASSKSLFQFPVGSSWYNAAHGLCDAVIAPRDTRAVVAKCLKISSQKKRLQFQPKQFPVYRF